MTVPMVVSLVGRANVGKSSLFNRLVKKGGKTLTYNAPGVTRERHYGVGLLEETEVLFIDTPGFYGLPKGGEHFFKAMREQTEMAMRESDIVLLVVDAREGLTPLDHQVARAIRKHQKTLWVVVNKFDSMNQEGEQMPFYGLGVDEVFALSSAHGLGVASLEEAIGLEGKKFAGVDLLSRGEDQNSSRMTIVGMPNSGKSTLLNHLLGKERALVSETPGTTVDPIEDSVDTPSGRLYLVDTAGIRKKSLLTSPIEQHSVYRALHSMEGADVVAYLIDSSKGISRQDKRLLSVALNKGKSLLICLNKIDLVEKKLQKELFSHVRRVIPWADFCGLFPLCAQSGEGLGQLMKALDKILHIRGRPITTGKLNKCLSEAVEQGPFSNLGGKRVKYASMVRTRPPTILLFSGQAKGIPKHYKTYLKKVLRKRFALENTPIRLVFRKTP